MKENIEVDKTIEEVMTEIEKNMEEEEIISNLNNNNHNNK